MKLIYEKIFVILDILVIIIIDYWGLFYEIEIFYFSQLLVTLQ